MAAEVTRSYAVQQGANARIRLYQTATDRAGYELMPSGERRWRFLARTRTRIVLPAGWDLSSLDQSALTHLDAEGRLVLDFAHMGGDVPELTLTARRSQKKKSYRRHVGESRPHESIAAFNPEHLSLGRFMSSIGF